MGKGECDRASVWDSEGEISGSSLAFKGRHIKFQKQVCLYASCNGQLAHHKHVLKRLLKPSMTPL